MLAVFFARDCPETTAVLVLENPIGWMIGMAHQATLPIGGRRSCKGHAVGQLILSNSGTGRSIAFLNDGCTGEPLIACPPAPSFTRLWVSILTMVIWRFVA